MNFTKNKLTNNSRWMMLLLSSSFLLLCLLAWQAFKSVNQQRLVAKKVLVEYAQLASEEYFRRISSDIGYRGYYLELNQFRDFIANSPWLTYNTWKPSINSCDDEVSDKKLTILKNKKALSRVYFIIKAEGIWFSEHHCNENIPYQFIINQLKILSANKINTNKPYLVAHLANNQVPVSLALVHEKDFTYGFLIDRNKLIKSLQASFSRRSLLPKILADGKVTNKMIDLAMLDHLGNNLISPQNNYPNKLVSEKHLTSEYNGIFNQHIIKVTIDPNSLEKLIIGGMPENNLPLIVLTLLSTLIVFSISIYQIQKENKLNQLRENFVAEVSHELRTPLTQIRMFSELISTGKSRGAEEILHYSQIINRESIRLSHLISNILSYSSRKTTNKHESQSHFTDYNIKQVIEEGVAEFLPIAEVNKNVISLELVDYITPTDSEKLKRIINNILDNAIKYGPKNQVINIISKYSEQNKVYQVEIIDQAMKIPPQHSENIWKAYFRLPTERKSAIAGTGIGLYIVKRLANDIGANIRLREFGAQQGNSFILEWEV